MSAGMSRRLRKLEEEYEAEAASKRRVRLYWIGEDGTSEPAWSDEEDERMFPSGVVGN
jgi:hypothetical protein